MLTQLAIIAAKPQDKPYKLSDGDELSLLIEPHCSRCSQLRTTSTGICARHETWRRRANSLTPRASFILSSVATLASMRKYRVTLSQAKPRQVVEELPDGTARISYV